jgi:acyl carrier protein
MSSVYDRVKALAAVSFSVDESKITPESKFKEDLGADSLDLVEFVIELEDEFSKPAKKLEISDDDQAKILTVQDAVNYLESRGITDGS